LINVLQLGIALLWAYVFFFKTISFGLLAWSVDQPVNVSVALSSDAVLQQLCLSAP
jgi:hypothetical protein